MPALGAGAAYHLARLVRVLSRVATVACVAAILVSLFGVALGGVVVLLVFQVLRRRLGRTAWSHVPGAFSWRFAARGDRLDYTERLLRTDHVWTVVEVAVWTLGGAVIVSIDGPGGLAWSAGVVTAFGVYLIAAALGLSVGRHGHWTLRPGFEAVYGAVWASSRLDRRRGLRRQLTGAEQPLGARCRLPTHVTSDLVASLIDLGLRDAWNIGLLLQARQQVSQRLLLRRV